MNYKYKKSTTIMCFVLCLFPCISGCYLPGGGGGSIRPPKKVICDKPWVITTVFSVWPDDPQEKYGKLTDRYRNVVIHIRDSTTNDYTAVPAETPGVVFHEGTRLAVKANMKPIPCDSGIEYVEYYMDFVFDGRNNSTKKYRVPVIRE
jgi:hypothetical protein